MKKYLKQKLFNALIAKDEAYVGKYYATVKTTGIFCKMDCSCTKPLYENVEFVKSIKECLEQGFRSCKVCLPVSYQFSNNNTEYICEYTEYIEKEEFPDKSYKEHPISSMENLVKIKKIFEKTIGLSLGKYIRLKRINYILNNDTSTKKMANKIFFNRINTPIGVMIFCFYKDKLILLEFSDRIMLETELQFLKDKLKGFFVYSESSFSEKVSKQMKEYFDKNRTSFSIELNTIGTDFQKKAWNALTKIPYGETISYKEQAENIKNPLASRAVGTANGNNMIAIIIPCHRVITSDGELGGYGGGIERKKYLLSLENTK